MSSAVNSFVQAIRKRSKKCLAQKVACFGSLRPIPMIQPPLDSSWVALQYEPGTKFSIEQFPSYTQLNIGAKITILHINPVYNVLMIINQDKTALSLDHARLPWLLKLFEGFLDHTCTTCSAQPQLLRRYSIWQKPESAESKSWKLHTQWNCVDVPSLAYNMNSWYNVLPSSLLFHWSNTVLRVCIHVTPVCMGVHERGGGGRGWVAVNS